MSSSENQFNELLAQIIVRTNKMLAETQKVIPFGLTLSDINSTDVILAIDIGDSLSECLNFLQDQLKSKVQNSNVLATSIVYANYENSTIEAFLENNENYCLKAIIPVQFVEGQCNLVPSEIETEDGGIYVFPFIEA